VNFDPRATVPLLSVFCRSGYLHAFFLIGLRLKTISLGFNEGLSAFTDATARGPSGIKLKGSLHHRAARASI